MSESSTSFNVFNRYNRFLEKLIDKAGITALTTKGFIEGLIKNNSPTDKNKGFAEGEIKAWHSAIQTSLYNIDDLCNNDFVRPDSLKKVWKFRSLMNSVNIKELRSLLLDDSLNQIKQQQILETIIRNHEKSKKEVGHEMVNKTLEISGNDGYPDLFLQDLHLEEGKQEVIKTLIQQTLESEDKLGKNKFQPMISYFTLLNTTFCKLDTNTITKIYDAFDQFISCNSIQQIADTQESAWGKMERELYQHLNEKELFSLIYSIFDPNDISQKLSLDEKVNYSMVLFPLLVDRMS